MKQGSHRPGPWPLAGGSGEATFFNMDDEWRARLKEGMTVYTAEGIRLGLIIRCDVDSFLIERGLFFPQDYLARYQDIGSVEEEEVRLLLYRDELVQVDEEFAAAAGVAVESPLVVK
jgi:hypothetical protein